MLNSKILAIVIVALAFSARLYSQASDGTALLKHFRLPQYNAKTNKAEFILYGKEADALGIVVNINGVLVDILSKEITDIRVVKNLENLNVYDITLDSDKVQAFWRDKPCSTMLIQTPSAKYDRSTQIIKGKEWLKVRSHFLDMDGVGFEADHGRQTLHIDKNVKVVYRKDLADAAKKESAEKEKKAASTEKNDKGTEKNGKTDEKSE
ncbi:MAG: hypothetical protein A2020_12775 [Lentisphaerae bacterium GWF2_45_14]|nr:MAG: hypothetical protein A2020_12775 [Lentisphaerae bacterium GWF2_45_14]